MKEEFINLLKSTNRENMDKLIDFIEKTDFFKAPASTRFHGAFEGGLLEHSMKVYEILKDKDEIVTIKYGVISERIKEFKVRLKEKAEDSMKKVTSITENELVGDMVFFLPGENAKSRLETTKEMTFEGMDVVDKIAATKTGSVPMVINGVTYGTQDDKPVKDVIIEKIEVITQK